MKSISGVLIVTCLLFCSCGNSTSEQEVLVQDNSDQLQNETIENTSFDESVLENFPRKWVQVLPKKDAIIYVEYCGMGHPALDIEETSEGWEILVSYGQDAERWELIDMTVNEKTVNNQTIQDGVFTVLKITYPDDETYTVDYFWNKTTGIATFGDFFDAGVSFADHANKATFVIEKEECDF